MVFLGLLYQPDKEKDVLSDLRFAVSNAPNQFQIRLLNGLNKNNIDVNVINVLPVGTWPLSHKKIFLPAEQWQLNGNKCYELSTFNVPFLKQYFREKKIKKKLLELTENDSEVLIYATYLPFLRAVKALPENIKTTLIVTDLPEYYDLGKTSLIKKLLRKINNKLIYDCLKRIDRFVLLTDAMKNPLAVGNRPYAVVEGFCDSSDINTVSISPKKNEVLFYSGTLHKQFGILQLLEAFEMLENKEAELWICGDGDCRDIIKEKATQNNKIKYFGYVSSDKVAVLRSNATVLINPRSNDGEYTKYSFPSKTMEYMASGVPVVMHKLSGIPNDYDLYLTYIKENTPAAIKDAIEKVFSMSDDERTALGQAAKRFVTSNKDEVSQSKLIVELIENN